MSYGTLSIATKSITKIKEVIRRITGRNRGISLEAVIEELNNRLPGWVNYFKLARCRKALVDLDKWIRHRLRCLRIKQCKRKFTLVKMLIAMGIKEYQAWILASSGKGWWRKAGTPQAHQAMNLHWFDNMGLKSLEKHYLSL